MKRFKILLMLLMSVLVFNTNVYAASGNLSVSSESVYVGDNFTVYVNLNSTAAWNVHVSANGPVTGCTINQADAAADAMDTNKVFQATCTATGTGTITIRLSGDVTSASDGNAVNISGIKNVTVLNKPIQSNPNNPTKPTNNSKSKNNNIKELIVAGYELTKVDNNNYTLIVDNDVASINVKAFAEDSKANVSGEGNFELNIGENNIPIVITSESGAQNIINIKVNRKEGYALEDLERLLESKMNNIKIMIASDTIITLEDLNKIKNSGKLVAFDYYDDNKNLVYSWSIDGTKINNTNDFITTVFLDSEHKKDILRLSNYADGLFINIKQTMNLPTGVKIKLYVENKFENDDLVNVYCYHENAENLRLIENKIKVEQGYIEFNPCEDSDYLITMSTIPNINENTASTKNYSSKVTLILIVILVLLLITIIIYIYKNNNKSGRQ